MTPLSVTAQAPTYTEAGRREGHSFLRGRAARETIMARIGDWPEALKLASQVADFYGDRLEYHESGASKSSRYEIKLQLQPTGIRYALVDLQLGTSRTTEALIHELLHLNIAVLGYPIGATIWVPPEVAHLGRHLIGIYPKLMNLLEHELIIEAFLFLGLDKANFLGCLCPAPDYEDTASRALPSMGYVEEIGFPWWCLEYFRHWISSRHGGGDGSGIQADNALYWGSRVHQDLEQAVRQICGFVESGAIRDRTAYPRRVNSILALMKIPGFAEWVTFQNRGIGRPVVASTD